MNKNYIFTKEVKRWGVEAGDIYSPTYHQIVGGTEKLLQDGIIKLENMSEQTPAVFVSGMYLDRVSEKAPAFIITNQTIHVEKMIEWLTANKNLANEKGYIRIQGKESKTVDEKGNFKRYFQVDTYVKPEPKNEVFPKEDINPEDIPFN